MRIDPPALPQTMQLVRVGEELSKHCTPPPRLPEIVQFTSVGEELLPADKPLEIVLVVSVGEELDWQVTLEIVQFTSVGEERTSQDTPPETVHWRISGASPSGTLIHPFTVR